MKKPLLFLLLLLATAAVHAANYTVKISMTEMEINGKTIFSGDTVIRFHTSGKDVNDRHTLVKADGWEIAISFEIKPGGKDPNLKKYGIKGKTWKYIRHTWYRKDNGEWEEVSSSSLWSYLQRTGTVKVTDSVTSHVQSAVVKTFSMAYSLGITQE